MKKQIGWFALALVFLSGCAPGPPAPPMPPGSWMAGVGGLFLLGLVFLAAVFWKSFAEPKPPRTNYLTDALNDIQKRVKELEKKIEKLEEKCRS